MEHAGLIHGTRDAQWRPCQLNAAPLKASAEWMAQYRQFWEGSLDRLERLLETTTTQEQPDDLPDG